MDAKLTVTPLLDGAVDLATGVIDKEPLPKRETPPAVVGVAETEEGVPVPPKIDPFPSVDELREVVVASAVVIIALLLPNIDEEEEAVVPPKIEPPPPPPLPAALKIDLALSSPAVAAEVDDAELGPPKMEPEPAAEVLVNRDPPVEARAPLPLLEKLKLPGPPPPPKRLPPLLLTVAAATTSSGLVFALAFSVCCLGSVKEAEVFLVSTLALGVLKLKASELLEPCPKEKPGFGSAGGLADSFGFSAAGLAGSAGFAATSLVASDDEGAFNEELEKAEPKQTVLRHIRSIRVVIKREDIGNNVTGIKGT